MPDSSSLPTANETVLEIRAPYLVFLGSVRHKNAGKTAFGLRDWCPEKCVGQIRLDPDTLDMGLPELSIKEAVAQGAKTLIIGVAPVGGSIEAGWISTLVEALEAGLDIAAGLHSRLLDHPKLAEEASKRGRRLIDVRVPPQGIPIANGKKRTGRRLLTVGTDCAVGKKYTALTIHNELQARSVKSTFRATGQTGILISGGGIPIDATVSDFTSGAAELVSPDNDPDHWDVIEGQGSIFHPAYAPVSIGLLHGSQPDAFIVCHEVGRERVAFYEDYPIPNLYDCIVRHIEAASLTNPKVRCVGISVNTASMDAPTRAAYLDAISEEFDLPAVDPLITGVAPIVDFLLAKF